MLSISQSRDATQVQHFKKCLCRIPTIQRESCYFIAHRLEAGRVPGTGLALSADQAYALKCRSGEAATLLGRCRFCTYPQEVVLRLEEPAKLEQIQILSHEYKVKAHKVCSKPHDSMRTGGA